MFKPYVAGIGQLQWPCHLSRTRLRFFFAFNVCKNDFFVISASSNETFSRSQALVFSWQLEIPEV